MARKKAATAKAGGAKPIDLSDDDHDAEGNIRPEVQARVNEEQRHFMARRKEQRDAEEKEERDNYAAKLDRAEKRRKEQADAFAQIAAALDDINKRLETLEQQRG